jgi:hypothetical protein
MTTLLDCRALVLIALGLGAIGAVGADPMRPLQTPGKAAAAPSAPAAVVVRSPDAPRPLGRLVAIRRDSQGRMQALIGERWVGVGDTLDQATVTAIETNQVDLRIGKTRSSLHLLPPLQASSEPVAERAVLALSNRAPAARPAGSPPR